MGIEEKLSSSVYKNNLDIIGKLILINDINTSSEVELETVREFLTNLRYNNLDFKDDGVNYISVCSLPKDELINLCRSVERINSEEFIMYYLEQMELPLGIQLAYLTKWYALHSNYGLSLTDDIVKSNDLHKIVMLSRKQWVA